MKRFLLMLLLLFVVAAIGVLIFLNLPKFGRAPEGERLERLKQSGFYKDGKVNNVEVTPQFAEDVTAMQVWKRFFFARRERSKPVEPFNFTKSPLTGEGNFLIWMGHSSYYLQLNGLKILVDPVFSGAASPVAFTTKAFAGTDLYTPDDFAEIDLLIITHDHWDHLDYKTINALKPKVKQVLTGLGTGAHLEHWGYAPEKIVELIWGENRQLNDSLKAYCETARHFSGRSLKRDQSMWASFVLESNGTRIYVGGDSGYGGHFKKIGEKFEGIDLAILEFGQYNEYWKYIHLMPGEHLQAMQDLNAAALMPVHNSKFSLAMHSWDEPLIQMRNAAQESGKRVIQPAIGQKVNWNDNSAVYPAWWEGLE